eukprot:8258164-Prorocentrum_lima.AAC.1
MVESGTLMNLMKSFDVLHECGWDHTLLMLRQQQDTAPLQVSKGQHVGGCYTMFTSESAGQKGSG